MPHVYACCAVISQKKKLSFNFHREKLQIFLSYFLNSSKKTDYSKSYAFMLAAQSFLREKINSLSLKKPDFCETLHVYACCAVISSGKKTVFESHMFQSHNPFQALSSSSFNWVQNNFQTCPIFSDSWTSLASSLALAMAS